MKTITINIPTTLKECKRLVKEQKSKRMRHNVKVLRSFAHDIITEVNRNYWSNDISPIMRKRVFDGGCSSSKISELYITAKSKLK